jgi:hypothetical protein
MDALDVVGSVIAHLVVVAVDLGHRARALACHVVLVAALGARAVEHEHLVALRERHCNWQSLCLVFLEVGPP